MGLSSGQEDREICLGAKCRERSSASGSHAYSYCVPVSAQKHFDPIPTYVHSTNIISRHRCQPLDNLPEKQRALGPSLVSTMALLLAFSRNISPLMLPLQEKDFIVRDDSPF